MPLILREDLSMWKISMEFVPWLLTEEQQSLAAKIMTLVSHAPYSSDLALCDFVMFP
jgi:hypothetical protein